MRRKGIVSRPRALQAASKDIIRQQPLRQISPSYQFSCPRRNVLRRCIQNSISSWIKRVNCFRLDYRIGPSMTNYRRIDVMINVLGEDFGEKH